jgi:hypothetical protein
MLCFSSLEGLGQVRRPMYRSCIVFSNWRFVRQKPDIPSTTYHYHLTYNAPISGPSNVHAFEINGAQYWVPTGWVRSRSCAKRDVPIRRCCVHVYTDKHLTVVSTNKPVKSYPTILICIISSPFNEQSIDIGILEDLINSPPNDHHACHPHFRRRLRHWPYIPRALR